MYQNESDHLIEEWLNSFLQVIEDTEFAVDENGDFCKIKNEKLVPLSNFILKPVEIITRVSESGVEEDYKFVFEGLLKREKILKPISILASDLRSPRWVQKWDVFCKIYGNKKKFDLLLDDYIYESLKGIPKRIEYDTIGWHQFEGKWFFLHSGGAIGETQGLNVCTKNSQFYFKNDDTLSAKDSFLGSLNMMDICDHKLSYSLLSFLLTSIITTPLLKSNVDEIKPNYLLWLDGRSGLGKTNFLKLFTNIYERINSARPDAHKTSIIIPGINEHKDCIFVIDDYGTYKTKHTMNSVIEKVESFIRNLADRHYSSTDISKGMVIIAGEKFLSPNYNNSSSKNRIIRLEMDNLFNRRYQDTYDAQKEEKFDLYKDKHFLPTSIMYYIEWLSKKLNGNFIDEYKREFQPLKAELKRAFNTEGRLSEGRHSDSFAHQILAFNFYMMYGKERGFITIDEFAMKCNEAKHAFEQLLENQINTISDVNVEMFLKALRELILLKKIIVKVNKSELNFDQLEFGVVRKESELVVLKLHWDTVYNLVSKQLENTHKLIGPTLLAQLLVEHHLIVDSKSNKPQFDAVIENVKTRPRFINFNGRAIPDIMKVVRDKAAETASVKDRFLFKAEGKTPNELFEFLN